MMLAVQFRFGRMRMFMRARRIGFEEIELIVGFAVLRGLRARQFFKNRVEADLRVVDLGGEGIAFGLQRVAFFADLREVGLKVGVLGAQLLELFLQRGTRLIVALADLDQPADVS